MQTSAETVRIYERLNPSTRETLARFAVINGITPYQVLSRMLRGKHIDLFPASEQARTA